jgi:periplasmic protein TonB
MTLSRVQVSWLASFALHAFVFCVGGLLIAHEVQYGIQFGQTSTEVDLVATPPEPQPQKIVQSPSTPVVEAPKHDDVVKPEEVSKPLPLLVQASKPIPTSPKTVGKDAGSVRATRGAMIAAQPNYLRNHPPVYPEICRQMHQQGKVQLLAEVSAGGNPIMVSLKESSGFRLLDAAAMQAVKRWKFQPATIGGLPITSRIEVPVQFELK